MERRLMALYRRAGGFWVIAAITGFSILLSVAATLTLVVPQLSPGHLEGTSLLTALAIAVAVPSLVAPPSVGLLLSLLVRLDSAYARVLRLSTTDQLTGAWNRRGFFAAAAEHLSNRDKDDDVLVGMLDIDRFKRLNDRFGHHFGDSVLQTLAQRLTEVLPERSALGRLGGDEFAFVCAGSPTVLDALQCRIRQLCDALPVQAESGAGVSASVGTVRLKPRESLDQGLARADAVLYAQKARIETEGADRLYRRYRSGEVARTSMEESACATVGAPEYPATPEVLPGANA